MTRTLPSGLRRQGIQLWFPVLLLPLLPLALAQGDVSCGLGAPPGSAAFEQHARLQDQQRRTLGHVLVCDSDLGRFDYASTAEPLEQATRRLAFNPVSLESTPFHQFHTLGGRPDHFGDGAPAALHRTFRTQQGYVVDLFEWDMSVSGGHLISRADLQTERVNGAPAQLTVVQTPSGNAVSILSWVEGRRSYQLSIDTNVKTSRVSPPLMQLASAIPVSVPARVIETEPSWPPPPALLRPLK